MRGSAGPFRDAGNTEDRLTSKVYPSQCAAEDTQAVSTTWPGPALTPRRRGYAGWELDKRRLDKVAGGGADLRF